MSEYGKLCNSFWHASGSWDQKAEAGWEHQLHFVPWTALGDGVASGADELSIGCYSESTTGEANVLLISSILASPGWGSRLRARLGSCKTSSATVNIVWRRLCSLIKLTSRNSSLRDGYIAGIWAQHQCSRLSQCHLFSEAVGLVKRQFKSLQTQLNAIQLKQLDASWAVVNQLKPAESK